MNLPNTGTRVNNSTKDTSGLGGRVCVVTGAGGGIGRAISLALAREGARVAVLDLNIDGAARTVEQVEASGGQAAAFACDTSDASSVTRAAEQTADAFGLCDVLVNNVGSNTPQAFLDVDLATLDRLLDLNVRSMFLVAQQAARRMVANGVGAIVNMSSQMGHVGAANRTVYCTTKHAIEGLTKAMAVELAPRGVRVNSVAPTYIETPLTRPFFADAGFREDTLRRIPMGRIGRVEEVAAAVAFLASPQASLITGTSLLVDGGYTAQ